MLTKGQEWVLKQLVFALKANDTTFQITGGLAMIVCRTKRPLYDIDIDIRRMC